MASTAQQYLDQFTVDNQGITDLRELLTLAVLQNGSLDEVIDMNFGILNGKRIGGIGAFEPLGKALPKCNPTYSAAKIATLEKVWSLGEFAIAQTTCVEDFEDTIVKFCLKTGNDRADLSATDLYTVVIIPELEKAINKALWRVFWMGDVNAASVDDDGIITDGVDLGLFNMTDGLFKRLMAIAPSGSDQQVPIAANAAATYALQRSGMRLPGVATSVFDDLIYNADMRLRQQSDRRVLCTQSFADALAIDIKASNKGSDLQWESLFGGLVYATRYNGEEIIALPIWDEIIREFNDTGVNWFAPHRALFAPKSNLLGGVQGTSFPTVLDIDYNKKERVNYIYARDAVGTQVWQDELIQFAY
jgi:hypothetical protein